MKIRPIFKTIDIFSFIQFLSRQTNYIIKFFLLKVLYLVPHMRQETANWKDRNCHSRLSLCPRAAPSRHSAILRSI